MTLPPFPSPGRIAAGHHFFLPRPKSEIVVTNFVAPYIPMRSLAPGSWNKNCFHKCLTNRGECIYLLRRKQIAFADDANLPWSHRPYERLIASTAYCCGFDFFLKAKACTEGAATHENRISAAEWFVSFSRLLVLLTFFICGGADDRLHAGAL